MQTTTYHVQEKSNTPGKWLRDWEPSETLEDARERAKAVKRKQGTLHSVAPGIVAPDRIPSRTIRIVKVIREQEVIETIE